MNPTDWGKCCIIFVVLGAFVCFLGSVPMIVVGAVCVHGVSWCDHVSRGAQIAILVLGIVILLIAGFLTCTVCGCRGEKKADRCLMNTGMCCCIVCGGDAGV